jgi:hypothetical protein
MHSNTTTLRELNLIETNIKIDETELPRNIVPYPVLETLKMTCKKFIDTSLLFVDYLTEKYSNLNTLDINDWMLQARPNTPTYHSVLTYRDYHPILADRILQLVTRLNVLKVEPRLFENFFDHLGSSLSHLAGIGIYSSKDMFTMFKNMNEFNFVKSLDGLTSLSLEAKNPKFLYHKNTTLPNIRNLDIFGQVAFANRTIELDRLLLTFNGLETLTMTCSRAKITIGDLNNRAQYQNLVNLSIEAAEIMPSVNSYLTDCLPNIKDIYWKSLNYPSNYTFNLPNHTIRSLNICTVGYGSYSYTTQRYDIKTSYDITTQHGLRPKYYVVVYPDTKKVRDEDDDATYRKVVNVEVTCRDLWKLKNDDVVIF